MKTFQQIFDERLIVAENMERWGGGFVSTLSMLIIKADRENLIKIHNTWPEYWKTYLEWTIVSKDNPSGCWPRNLT